MPRLFLAVDRLHEYQLLTDDLLLAHEHSSIRFTQKPNIHEGLVCFFLASLADHHPLAMRRSQARDVLGDLHAAVIRRSVRTWVTSAQRRPSSLFQACPIAFRSDLVRSIIGSIFSRITVMSLHSAFWAGRLRGYSTRFCCSPSAVVLVFMGAYDSCT